MKKIRRRTRRMQRTRRGGMPVAALFVFVFVLLTLTCTVSFIVWKVNPDIANKGVIVGLIGAFIAAVSWATKRVVEKFDDRVALYLLERLSNGDSLSRAELINYIRSTDWFFRLTPSLPVDCLAALVKEGKVVLEDGKYRSAQVAAKERLITKA